MDYMDYKNILREALQQLGRAAERLEKNSVPNVPLPRPRKFSFAAEVQWPYINKDNRVVFTEAYHLYNYSILNYGVNYIADGILAGCGGQPRLILRALRRIQAATAWCEARAEGRQRAAEEILRQQAKAVEALEAEAAMLALK